MSPVSWQVSATYMTSFVNASKALEYLPAAMLRLDAETRATVERPGSRAWWPGERLVTLLEAVETVGGSEAVKLSAIRGSRERMGPLVRPLASVLLSLTKTPMLTLVSRLATFAAAGVRGVDVRFVAHEGRAGGVVTFTLPEPVPAVMSQLWHGMFDVAFTLARARDGRIVSEQAAPTVHRFELTW